jgi:hypothetical protein
VLLPTTNIHPPSRSPCTTSTPFLNLSKVCVCGCLTTGVLEKCAYLFSVHPCDSFTFDVATASPAPSLRKRMNGRQPSQSSSASLYPRSRVRPSARSGGAGSTARGSGPAIAPSASPSRRCTGLPATARPGCSGEGSVPGARGAAAWVSWPTGLPSWSDSTAAPGRGPHGCDGGARPDLRAGSGGRCGWRSRSTRGCSACASAGGRCRSSALRG